METSVSDEHRRKLDARLTPLHLFKLTPKTNCGECGFLTCLAFSTQIIVGQGNLRDCPYLDPESLADFQAQLAAQHLAGIGLSRESFEKTFEFLRGEIGKWDFRNLAVIVGAAFEKAAGVPSLLLVYFGKKVRITSDDICSEPGERLDPWEKILLYNYVIGGAVESSGVWVGMESLPKSSCPLLLLLARYRLLPGCPSGLCFYLHGEAGIVDMIEPWHPLLMGKGSPVDDLPGQGRGLIEDVESEVKQVELFLIAFLEKETIEGSHRLVIPDVGSVLPGDEGMHETRNRLKE